MRPLLHAAIQAALWSMGPLLDVTGLHDSPSLLVMPLSAALAAVASRDWRGGLGMPVAGLAVVLVAYSVWTMSIGRASFGGAVAFAAGMLPFHVLGTWLLVGLSWWPSRKVRALAASRRAAVPAAR